MLERIRAHLTYANVISTLCLFLLLGGGAYAAFSLPNNSVKSKHIVDGQVKGIDILSTQVQERVGETCAPGLSIRAIGEDGTVTCESVGGAKTVWSGYAPFAVGQKPQADGHVAKFGLTPPASGFLLVHADVAIRARNKFDQVGLPNCHVESQLALAPGATQESTAGFADNWINGNLPTQQGDGTYLEFNQSMSRVFSVSAEPTTIYLNGAEDADGTDCQEAIWGPITFTAIFAENNPASTVNVP